MPPEWALQHVEAQVAEPALFAATDGRVAELTPILTAAPCVNCHGATDTLAPAVVARLAELYPQDQAVGFAEGDLRGWFWVEAEGAP